MAFGNQYHGLRVLVTGHSGFKGAWLCEWLLALGAKVTGLSLPPPTDPSLFDQLGLGSRMTDLRGDVRSESVVQEAFERADPDLVFHLAAQPLVRASYDRPEETFGVNVMGTVNVLETARRRNRPCRIVLVTTDKCYENREWVHAYRETDELGGADPYSASKGAAELVISAYRRSFFSRPGSPVRVASARAGNVIGGGDWALDRIVPDCIRALGRGEPVLVRNKTATRPWQHVLEPLGGYLLLGALLGDSPSEALCTAFNFGPELEANRTVADLVENLLRHWPGGSWKDASDPNAPHEAARLNLAIDKARHVLGWNPVFSFETAVERTATWYREAGENDPRELVARDVAAYTQAARGAGLSWV